MTSLAEIFLREFETNPDLTLAEFHELHGYPDEREEDFGSQVMRAVRRRYEE